MKARRLDKAEPSPADGVISHPLAPSAPYRGGPYKKGCIPHNTITPWTEERIQMLTALWRRAFSSRQIAERLGGTTRNGVIGKAHRLGLKHPYPRDSWIERRT